MKSGVNFHAVDMPNANNLTIHIMAAMAEAEAEAISTRTKAALQTAKARGVKLGGFAATPATSIAKAWLRLLEPIVSVQGSLPKSYCQLSC